MIALIDFKIRNDESVIKMVQKLRVEPDLTRNSTELDLTCGKIQPSAGSMIIYKK